LKQVAPGPRVTEPIVDGEVDEEDRGPETQRCEEHGAIKDQQKDCGTAETGLGTHYHDG